jgi:hypothetical protein
MLKTRLRRRKIEEAKPTPVYLRYDYFTVTKEQAIKAAGRSGKIPLNAVFVLIPELPEHANWETVVKREYAERERRLLEQQQLLVNGKPGE